ncbi:MAG: endonuclease, partial [Candidatus Dormibacteraeota bacterium]|nr:endonuclease [Candidatus Dormibacteraeota bacterium]
MPDLMSRLRIATYNILSGGGSRWAAIAEMVQAIDADVLALQEIEDPRPMYGLADRLGYRAVFGRAPRFRHQGLLSRLPL